MHRNVKQYFGPNGEKIEELNLVDTETGLPPTDEQMASELTEPEPRRVFLGVMLIPVGVHAFGPDGNPMLIDVRPQEMRFPIEVETLKEAFQKYPELSEKTLNELKQKQAEKSKKPDLVVPNASESNAINKMKLIIPE